MARPGFKNHPKFLRLVHILRLPAPHVFGHVQWLWDVSYECGNARIGDVTDVELSACWTGETGVFCAAMVAVKLLDVTDDVHFVHDLFDHAPDYVTKRYKRESEREKEKICLFCETTYRSSDDRSKFCSGACRTANHRGHSNGQKRTVTQSNTTRAPARARAPAPNILNTPSVTVGPPPKSTAQRASNDCPNDENGPLQPPEKPKKLPPYAEDFEAWWRVYPQKVGKQRASEKWKTARKRLVDAGRTDEEAREHLLSTAKDFAASDKGRGDFCPHPSSWLEQGRYDDDQNTWKENGRSGQLDRSINAGQQWLADQFEGDEKP